MTMKRKRKPSLGKPQRQSSDQQIGMSCVNITDLPSTVFVDILLKMSMMSIIMCKSVCKTWYSLISDPEFTKLHLAQTKISTLIRDKHHLKISRSLYLLEPEDKNGYKSGFCQCKATEEKCKHCRFGSKVKKRLKVPIWNAGDMLQRAENDTNKVMFCIATTSKSKSLIKMRSNFDHRSDVVNSCNGLLCLAKMESLINEDTTRPVVVCNPVTGEFMYLPKSFNDRKSDGVKRWTLGLGYSPKHKEYKVIRMFDWWTNSTVSDSILKFVEVAEIHTLGTNSWRSLDISGIELGVSLCPSYLNGSIYWLLNGRSTYQLVSFNFDEERFQVHSIPSPAEQCGAVPELATKAVGNRLYMYTTSAYTHVNVWMMNGDPNSWTELFTIEVAGLQKSPEPRRFQYLYFQFICCLSDEAVLLFGGPRDEFIYYHNRDGLRFKQVKVRGLKSEFEVFSYTPSFISLRDIVVQGGNVQVFNVYSGCGKLKLAEENYPLLLGGSRS